MDDVTLVSTLSESYQRQLLWYMELADLVQKIMSQLILSRGNVAGVMEYFSRKQKIFDMIVEERNSISEQSILWQDRKHGLAGSEDVDNLNTLFDSTACAIKKFLEIEDQLKTYLEQVTHK
jgi:hypothetical protein